MIQYNIIPFSAVSCSVHHSLPAGRVDTRDLQLVPQYTTVKYREPHYTTVKYREPQYTTVKYREPHYTTVQYREPQYTTVQYFVIYCTVLYCTVLVVA